MPVLVGLDGPVVAAVLRRERGARCGALSGDDAVGIACVEAEQSARCLAASAVASALGEQELSDAQLGDAVSDFETASSTEISFRTPMVNSGAAAPPPDSAAAAPSSCGRARLHAVLKEL